jgi:PKD repeat protein
VLGSHTYTEGGSYQVYVTIQSSGGSSASIASTATVADLALTGTGLNVTPAVTGSNTTLTASFTDANTSENPANYMAQINWGDNWVDDVTVSGSNGSYTLNGSHAYDHPGNYAVTVTVTDAGGATLTQKANTTISAAALSASGATLTATAGQALSNAQIATFTDGNTDQMNDYYGPASGYTTSINWGDGTGLDTSAAVMGDESGFYVIGNHTYSNTGAYTATVTITNADGASTTATSTVDVTTMTPTGGTVSASEGVAANNVAVATFTDTQPSSYTASIDWGDGSPTDVGTIAYSNGVYTVTGSHTYTNQGSYTATVYVGDDGGATTMASPTVTVTAPVINATAEDLSAQEGVLLNNVTVATFSAPGQASDYTATVDWGDGNSGDGVISGSNGSFSVLASNAYAEQTGGQQFAITVTITDAAGDSATVISSAIVDPGTMSTIGANQKATEGALNQFTLASITDTDPSYSRGDFTALVDWGDGSPEEFASVSGSNGVYSVYDTHTYAEDGSYTATVTITDPNGLTTQTVNDTVSVVDAALTAAAADSFAAVTVTEGAMANSFPLTQFNDANLSEVPSAFTASINWGDGTAATTGVVNGAGGLYSVSGSHEYAVLGYDRSYTATITVKDAGGSQVVLTTPVTVYAAPEYTVATFTDSNKGDTASEFSASINWGDGTPASGGIVWGGDGTFAVFGYHTYVEEGTYTVTTTITGPNDERIEVQSTATVLDPGLNASASPPAPPQTPAPAVAVPEISYSLNPPLLPGTYSDAIAALIGNELPLRIHVDDSSYVKVETPDKQKLISDNLQKTIDPSVDLDLTTGNVTIGPAGTVGTLGWSVPNSVRVWWQPTANRLYQKEVVEIDPFAGISRDLS